MEEILDQSPPQHEGDLNGPSLHELREQGYTFDFGKYFNTGWKIMKDDVGQFILFTLVMGLIIAVSLITLVGPILLALPLSAGYWLYGKKILHGEDRQFNDFFGGFKYFGPLVGYTLLMIAVISIFVLPLVLLTGIGAGSITAITDDPEAGFAAMTAVMLPFQLLVGFGSIFLQAFLFFVVPLIVIGQLSTWSAIRWSARIASKNYWWVVLFIFVVGIVSQAGAFACYVGLLFTAPLAQCISLGAYAEIVGLGDKSADAEG